MLERELFKGPINCDFIDNRQETKLKNQNGLKS